MGLKIEAQTLIFLCAGCHRWVELDESEDPSTVLREAEEANHPLICGECYDRMYPDAEA
jgi:hypothetical protein